VFYVCFGLGAVSKKTLDRMLFVHQSFTILHSELNIQQKQLKWRESHAS